MKIGFCHVTHIWVILNQMCDSLQFAMTSRNWCFTINNPQSCPLPVPPSSVKLLVYQLEEGEENTSHIQGYVEFTTPVRMRAVKRIYPRAHIEPRRGTRLQAVQYVVKEETRREGPWIHPEEPLESLMNRLSLATTSTGRQSRLEEIKLKLDEGCSEATIADEHFGDWVRHFRAFREYKLMKTEPRSLSNAPRILVIWGPTGTGKSRYCIDNFPNAYWKQRSNWWDGYSGQKTIILDEFYGWIPYDLLLRLCDRYPLLVETKGGQLHCLANTIIITSNTLPHEWYKNCYFQSFERRVTKWMVAYDHVWFYYKKYADLSSSAQ